MSTTIRKPWRVDSILKVDNLSGCIITGESGAHTFVIYGVNGDEEVPITGTISATFLRADNVTVPIDNGTITAGEAVITLPSRCYEVPGRFVLSIFATGTDTNTCIYCGVGSVYQTQTETFVDPGTIIPSISDLIDEIERVNNSIPADYSTLATLVGNDNQRITALAADVATNAGDIENLETNVTGNTTKIGSLSSLVTPNRGNLVEAINDAYNHTEEYDAQLSPTSENAVQNKVVKAAIDGKMNTPVSGGTAGQCLMSDGQGSMVWGTPTEVQTVLGDLALKDRVQATYTPRGTVSAPTISASVTGVYVRDVFQSGEEGSVTPGSAATCTLPSLSVTATGKNLVFAWTAGSFTPNTPTVVTMPVFSQRRIQPGVTATATAPTFTGTQETITST